MADLSQMSDQELLSLYNREKELAAWGPGAQRAPDGSIFRIGPRGGRDVLKGASSDPTDPGGVKASAEQRARIGLSLDPLISAGRDLEQVERRQAPNGATYRNPWSEAAGPAARNPIEMAANWLDATGNTIARNSSLSGAARDDGGPWAQTFANSLGGEDFQEANQAYATFEASLMPIFSGAAVTASEAQRFLRSNVPSPGESPTIVQRKERNRRQMANAAARISGLQPPFPDAPTAWPLSQAALQEFSAISGAQPQQARPVPRAQDLPRRDSGPRGPSGRSYTPQQIESARSIPGGARGALGSATNPYMINSKAQWQRLPAGAHFIDDDGNRSVR